MISFECQLPRLHEEWGRLDDFIKEQAIDYTIVEREKSRLVFFFVRQSNEYYSKLTIDWKWRRAHFFSTSPDHSVDYTSFFLKIQTFVQKLTIDSFKWSIRKGNTKLPSFDR